jgi:hypothetical protein
MSRKGGKKKNDRDKHPLEQKKTKISDASNSSVRISFFKTLYILARDI